MKSILFIDDDLFVTTLYKTKLQSEGFVVDMAHNGGEALEKLNQSRPDVIVLDLNMPGTNGVEVLRSIRSAPRLRHIPVIIFSNGYVRTLVEEASQLGIHKFFAKGQCPPKVLISEIKELLSRTAAPPSSLALDADAAPGNPAAGDLPALLHLFIESEDPAMQHAALLKIYKAARPCINRALEAEENTARGKLGRILEKLFENLYDHPEHITGSTKETLSAGLQKLGRLDEDEVKPMLESELALKDLLRSLE